MLKWHEDPTLFLYKGQDGEGSVLSLWRCKRMPTSIFLGREDFTDETPIHHLNDLISKGFPWNKSYVDALESSIYPRNFLVNSQGLVYVELHKADENEKFNGNQQIYLRLLDALNLEAFGLRKVKLTAGLNSQSCGIEALHKEMKGSAELDAVVDRYTCEVAILQGELYKEKYEKLVMKNKIVDLEAKIGELVDKQSKLIADFTARIIELATSNQLGNNKEKNAKHDWKIELPILEDNNRKLSETLIFESRKVTDLQQKLNEEKSEPWMDHCTIGSNWVCVEALQFQGVPMFFDIINKLNVNFTRDHTTNVQPEYFYQGWYGGTPYVLVKLGDLIPNKEKARFDRGIWTLAKDNSRACWVWRISFKSKNALVH